MKLLRLKTHYFHSKLLCQKLTYHKEWSFASNCFIFLKICFSFRTSWKELIWCTNDPNLHIRIFRKRWSLILGCFFPVSIPNLGFKPKFQCSKRAIIPYKRQNYLLLWLDKIRKNLAKKSSFQALTLLFILFCLGSLWNWQVAVSWNLHFSVCLASSQFKSVRSAFLWQLLISYIFCDSLITINSLLHNCFN